MIAVAVAVCILLGWPATPADGETANTLKTSIAATLSSFSGVAAVIVADPLRGAHYRYDADRVFPAASLYKLAVMVEAYRQAEAGQISLEQPIVVGDQDLGDGGEETPAGTSLSVSDAIERMITISDNSCAHALLDLLDTASVNATAAGLGLADTRINMALDLNEQTAGFNTTTAADMERLFSGLVNGAVVSPHASADMLGVLGRQRVNDRLPAGLPDGTPVAHKTANLNDIAHDAGVIATAFGPRVVVVLTAGADYADVIALTAEIARAALTLPFDDFSAAVTVRDLSAVRPGGVLTATVTVTNRSSFAWAAGFSLASHWRDASFAYVRWDGERASLPPLAPGRSATVTYRALAPVAREPIGVLELDVVHEGVAWTGAPLRVVIIFSRP